MITSKLPDIKTLELVAKDFATEALVDIENEIDPRNLHIRMRYMVENGLYALRMLLRVPSQVLRDDYEITRYPRSRWDNFLHAIGLGRFATYTTVKVSEVVAFPSIAFPEPYQKMMRVYYHTGFGVATP